MKCFPRIPSARELVTFAFLWCVAAVGTSSAGAAVNRPFPQNGNFPFYGLRPTNYTQAQLNSAVTNYYFYWKSNYLAPSTRVPGDFKVNFDGTGKTVSEAMGYGMLITVYMAGADPAAKTCFDGLNRFRKWYPSDINPALMCWQIPASEADTADDCATDGDLDMALALLLAYHQWGETNYLTEATNLINAIGTYLVRGDFSLRLGDWNSSSGQTRLSDFMPAHCRSFYLATGNALWTNAEAKCYSILEQLQTNSAPATGLFPDFSVVTNNVWMPAAPNFLESPHDGEFYYNSCRTPWRIGWAASLNNDDRPRRILSRFMSWTVSHHAAPGNFRAGYKLDRSSFTGNNYDTACFISPTGVAAMTTTNQAWLNATFTYAKNKQESYYEDSVSLLCMLVMSGNAWLPVSNIAPRLTQLIRNPNGTCLISGAGPEGQNLKLIL